MKTGERVSRQRGRLRIPALACLPVFLLSLAEPRADETRDAGFVFLGNRNIAPVVYLDNAIPSGIAIDIVRTLSKHMPRPIEIKVMDWKEAQALVARGEADALIQINQTEERKKTFDFSDTLLESQFSIFVRSDRTGISGLSSLRGLRVGVESGGLPQQQLEKTPSVLLKTIPNFIDGFGLLNDGALDAIVVDYRVGAYILAVNKIRNIMATGEPIAFSYSSFAVKKGNAELLEAINGALRKIKADGSYLDILDKWKPKEGLFLTQEQIRRQASRLAVVILLALFAIAVIWMATLKKNLAMAKASEGRLREQYSTLRGIINSADALIFSIDRQYRYTSFNEGHATVMRSLYGAEIESKRCLLDYMTVPEDRETAKRNLDRALAGERLVEESYSGEELLSRKYFRVSHSPILGENHEIIGVAGLAQDISERKLSEEVLRRQNREIRVIGDCNQALMRSEDEPTLLGEICRIVCGTAGYAMAWVGYADGAGAMRTLAWASAEGSRLSAEDIPWAGTDRGSGSCVALPLKDESALAFGTLQIYSTEPNAFTPDELRMLEELSGDLAFGIRVLRSRVERKRAEEELQSLTEELETRVRERTAELKARNRDLENLNRLFVGRELRMKELKGKIAELEGKTAEEEAG